MNCGGVGCSPLEEEWTWLGLLGVADLGRAKHARDVRRLDDGDIERVDGDAGVGRVAVDSDERIAVRDQDRRVDRGLAEGAGSDDGALRLLECQDFVAGHGGTIGHLELLAIRGIGLHGSFSSS